MKFRLPEESWSGCQTSLHNFLADCLIRAICAIRGNLLVYFARRG